MSTSCIELISFLASEVDLCAVIHDIYIYIYIYIVFFGPVKLELGVIPSGQEIIHE